MPAAGRPSRQVANEGRRPISRAELAPLVVLTAHPIPARTVVPLEWSRTVRQGGVDHRPVWRCMGIPSGSLREPHRQRRYKCAG